MDDTATVDTTDRSPSEVIERMVEMFATGDLSSVVAVVDPDYLDHQRAGSGDPTGGDRPGGDGPERFGAVVASARSGYDSLDVTVEDLIETDDRVAVRLRWRGTGPTGTDERETIDIVRVRDGRAVEHWGGRS